MIRFPVDSKFVVSVGYDPSAETLEVELKEKADSRRTVVYEYYKVPARVFDALMSPSTKSKGAYFQSDVKGVYTEKKISR